MDFEALYTKIVNKIVNDGKIKTYEDFCNMLNDDTDLYGFELKTLLEKDFEQQSVTSADLIKMKDYLLNNGKLVGKNFKKDIKFSDDFGKENQEQSRQQFFVQNSGINIIVNRALKDTAIGKAMNLKDNRQAFEFLIDSSDDPKEFQQIMNVFMEKDDTKEYGTTGKTYNELKQEIFIKQLNKVESVCDYLLKPNKMNYDMFILDNYSTIKFLQEVDGAKLASILDKFNIDKNNPKIKEKLASVEKYKDFATTCGNTLRLISIKSNPLMKYGTFDDIAKFSKMASYIKNGLDYVETISDKIENNSSDVDAEFEETLEKFTKIVEGTTNMTALNSLNKDLSVIPSKANQIVNGEKFQKFEVETFMGILSVIAESNGTNIDSLEFYNDKKKKINLSKETDLQKKVEKLYELALNGENITIKDKNGMYLDTYKTIEGNNGFPVIENNIFDFNLEDACNDFESKFKEKNLDEYKPVDAKKDLDESLNMKMHDYVGYLKGIINPIYDNDENIKARIEGKADEFNDIGLMIQELKDTDLTKTDKLEYFSGLKSIRTFCHAYLDTNLDSKNKDTIEKCKLIQNVYKSLQGIESAMNRAIDCENNIMLKYNLNDVALTEKDINDFEKSKEDQKYKKEEKVRVFDVDPTINNNILEVEDRVENKEVQKNLNIDDINVQKK